MPKKTKNKYNHYTEDFRREAVRRSEDPNTSAVEVARELVSIRDKFIIGGVNTADYPRSSSTV